MKKFYARKMEALGPADERSTQAMIPVLQEEVVPHALADKGALAMFFFKSRRLEADGRTRIFSFTIYDTQEHLKDAMKEADSQYRFDTLAKLNCEPIDAGEYEVIAGAVQGNVSFAESDFIPVG